MSTPLDDARQRIGAGDLDGAEKLLGDAARKPEGRGDARLNHLYGQVLHDLGKLDRAITHYRRALRLAPGAAEMHRDLGVAYESKTWLKEATECFRQAVRLDAHDELAHSFLGRALRAQGQNAPALKHFARAAWIKLKRPFGAHGMKDVPPPEARAARDSRFEEAREAFGARRFAEAEAGARALLEANPRDAEALALVARVCGKTNRVEEGIHYAARAVDAHPKGADAHVVLGELLFRAERLDEAAASLHSALTLEPENARAWAGLALVEHRRERQAEAEQHARRAMELDPGSGQVNNVCGFVLLSGEQFAQAEPYCREAIRLEPDQAGAYINLAHSLKERGRVEEARESLRQAAERLSDEARSYCHLAGFEMDMGDIEAAIEHARRALIHEPGHVDAHVTLANLLLLAGRYDEGWLEYEWRARYRKQAAVHDFFRKRLHGTRQWVGTALDGKTLLVYSEQALGEQILFSSCIAEVASRAKSVTLLCDERLVALLQRSFPQVRVAAAHRGDELRDFRPDARYDLYCAAGGLAGLLKRSRGTIPGAAGYLRPDAAKVQRWRARLAALGPGLKVGISWRGGVIATGRFKRSLDLELLKPLLETPGVRWISMQYTRSQDEMARLRAQHGIELEHWPEGVDDFDEHAALAAALDHRISVCNTLVHLSGAMGLRTWVLSPPATIWPYGLGAQMPWYPSVTIYRQRRYKDWTEPVSRVAADLRALVAGLCDDSG